jgi:hypothetical protein
MGKQKKPTAPKKRVTAKFKSKGLPRDLLVLFLLSFFISTALITYLFGMTDDFFSRLFWCILVIFLLLVSTVLGIVPFINYLSNKWPK